MGEEWLRLLEIGYSSEAEGTDLQHDPLRPARRKIGVIAVPEVDPEMLNRLAFEAQTRS